MPRTAMGRQDHDPHLFEVGGVLHGDVEDLPGEPGDEESLTVGDAAGG